MTISDRLLKTAGVAIAVVALGATALSFGPSVEATNPQTPDNCNQASLYLEGRITAGTQYGNTAYATVTNHSKDCAYQIGFASYKITQPNDDLASQTLFDSVSYTVAPGDTVGPVRLQIQVPDCRYQLDLFEGPVLTPPFYGGVGHYLMDYQYGHTNLCGSTGTPTPTPTPSYTPTPTPVRTPTPTPPTPTPTPATPTPSVLPVSPTLTGTYIAQCYTAPRIELSWNLVPNRIVNGLIKNIDNGDGFFVEPGPAFNQSHYTDTAISYGHTYSYRVKAHPQVPSNMVTIVATAPSCPTPTPTPTYTPTPTPSYTPTPTPTLVPVSVDIKCNGIDGPCTIAQGSAATLSWTSTNATSCLAFGGWSGPVATTGSGMTTGPLFSNQVYNIICSGIGGSASDFTQVNVIGYTPTPTPTNNLSCSPSYQTIGNGQIASFSANGGTGVYYWTASGGDPSVGFGSSFSTRFYVGSYDETRNVLVQSGNQQAVCSVRVTSGYYTPTPTPTNNSWSLDKTVRNITTGTSESDVVSASQNDTVEFVIRLSLYSQYYNYYGQFNNIRVYDFLPSGLRLISGSTTVDGTSYSDNITGGGLYLGNRSAGQTVTIRFRAVVDTSVGYSGTNYITNTANATADNTSGVSDTARVQISGTNPSNNAISIQKLGRNLTRGETGELTTVVANANDTIEFIIRVRSLNNTTLYNLRVSDLLPAGLTYVYGSTNVNGVQTSDAITAGGITIGTLYGNQETVIRFSARVDNGSTFPNGTLIVTNVAQAIADNQSQVSAQLPITRTRIFGITTVPTGPVDTGLLAILTSALITYGYMLYSRTQIFDRRLAFVRARRVMNDVSRLNFARFLR